MWRGGGVPDIPPTDPPSTCPPTLESWHHGTHDIFQGLGIFGGKGGAQWGKFVINSLFCIFMYFLNKTLCRVKGLGGDHGGATGAPCATFPQGANPCKDTKCTVGACGSLPPPDVLPVLMPHQSWCVPPTPLPTQCPPCPGVPGTLGGLPAG